MKSRPIRAVILLAAVLACPPAGQRGGQAFAADSGFKTYRNERYGFEFRYPGDMAVATSSTAAPSCDQRHWQNDDVHVIYCPSKSAVVWAAVRVGNSINEDYCLRHDDDSIRYGAKVNGFSEAELVPSGDMGHMSPSQDYVAFVNGKCVHIEDNMDLSRNAEPRVRDDASVHFAQIKEIVKSFRFLDSEPASPAGRPKAN
jgi:hypothetical protein